MDLARIIAESAAPPSTSGANAPVARLPGGHPHELPDAARAASPLTYVPPAAPSPAPRGAGPGEPAVYSCATVGHIFGRVPRG